MNYFTKITKAGLSAITAALNNNSKMPITYMAFGDGNGSVPIPNENSKRLVNEVYRVGINKIEVHEKNPNWLVCEAIIPSAVGGFNIREVALFDNSGLTMLAVANYPPTYKPSIAEGAAKIQTIRIIIQVDNTGDFELIIDPDIVLATYQGIQDAIKNLSGGELDFVLSQKVKGSFLDGSEHLDQFLNKIEFKVESILDLKALNPKNAITVYMEMHSTLSKLGGGKFKYVPDSTEQADDGLIIEPLSGKGRWYRQNLDVIHPFLFGAVGDHVTDDCIAIKKAQAAARKLRKECRINGMFASSEAIIVLPWDVLKGEGKNISRIRKITNNVADLEARKSPEVAGNDRYDVDALIIAYPYSGHYAGDIKVNDIFFERGVWGQDGRSDYGLYAPRLCKSQFEDIQLDNTNVAIRSMTLFLNRMVDITAIGYANNGQKSDIGMFILASDNAVESMTGTSNTFERIQLVNYRKGFSVCGMQYSTFMSCTAEGIENNAGQADSMCFEFYNPRGLTVMSCGVESSYSCPIYVVNTDPNVKGTITFISFSAAWGINGTANNIGMNLMTVVGNVVVTIISSWIRKSGTGNINEFIWIGEGAEVKNIGSTIGNGTSQGPGILSIL